MSWSPTAAADTAPPDIVVTALKLNEAFGDRSGLSLDRVPQSVQVVTREDVITQGARSIGDALLQVPSANGGVTRIAPFQSFVVSLRGFPADQMRNGVRQRGYEDVDPSALSNVERIEVLKGPSSVLFGESAVGGIVSIITKRPQPQWAAELSLTGGSYGERRGTFDLTGPVVAGGALSFRATGEIERSDTFFDFVDLDRTDLAFSLAATPIESVSGHLVVEWQDRDTVGNPGLPAVGTVLSNGIAPIPRRRNLNEPGVALLKLQAPLVQAWADIALAPAWSITPRLSYNRVESDIIRTGILSLQPDLRTIQRFAFASREVSDSLVAQIDVHGSVRIGGTSHRLLIGAEWARDTQSFRQDRPASVTPIDVIAPVYGTLAPPPYPTLFSVRTRLREQAGYIQDVATINDALELVFGLRYSSYDTLLRSFDDRDPSGFHALTWQAGGTFRLGGGVSLFGGYNTGFDVDAVVGSRSADGKQFDPQRSGQAELGLRVTASTFTASASLFDIRRTNVLTEDPLNPGFALQAGTQRVRGVEAEARWQPSPAWSLQGGYAHLRSRILRSNDGNMGEEIADVPRNRANLRVQFTPALLRGRLTLRSRVNHVGSRLLSNIGAPVAPGLLASDVRLSSYTIFGFGMGLDLGFARVDADLSNAFDRRYFVRGGAPQNLYPGEPRLFSVRVTKAL
ncbi:TonB-dependent receptor [Sphingomonas sp. ID1715]|uniref:TonB-dependent siderophore receptor n=1 Tax=Sphingomonas sp. ID1715 TaxID=1656898 RepID=UPI001487AEBB|nr:TonB-dependent receptor [Sphingomonas sp. ID1715]NNM76706.1 TonB-dependent receptor [Sphingomonas sp. ID1715]